MSREKLIAKTIAYFLYLLTWFVYIFSYNNLIGYARAQNKDRKIYHVCKIYTQL